MRSAHDLFSLDGTVAIVTCGASGIRLATAEIVVHGGTLVSG